jgi:hypothetical protein
MSGRYWSQGQACFGDTDTRAVHEALENHALSLRGKSMLVGCFHILSHPVELEPEARWSGKPVERQGRSAQQRAGR